VLTLKAKAESDLWEKDVVIPFVDAYIGGLSAAYDL
jgi:hypothetical protein